MQLYKKNLGGTLKITLLFMLVCFMAYLPISSFQFFFKNDAFNGYFPPSFFLSKRLHAGYLSF